MAKITFDTILSGFKSVTQFINNFTEIKDHLDNKVLYRDNVSGEPNQMENDLDMNSNYIRNVGGIGDDYILLTQGSGDVRYVNVTGDTMTGTLDMSTSKITSLGYPSATTDAASLLYVNDKVADAISSLSFEVDLEGYNKVTQQYTVTLTGDTSFTIPLANPASIEVFINGVHQVRNDSYTVAGNTVTFTEGLVAGDKITALIGTSILSYDLASITSDVTTAVGGESVVPAGDISASNPTEVLVFVNGVKQSPTAYTIDYVGQEIDFGTTTFIAGTTIDVVKVEKIADVTNLNTIGANTATITTINAGTLHTTGNIASSGDVSLFPASVSEPTTNGQMTFELTNDTTLTIKVKGSDSVVRAIALTLS